MDKILTIAVPAYNVESLLPKCLDSFVCKNMDMLEVLVVNDGSTDNTASVAKEYEVKYPDTFRVINKQNGGHGSGINIGIKQAKGKYFKLVDGDDWVNTTALDKILIELQSTDADMVLTNYSEVFDGSNEIIYRDVVGSIGNSGDTKTLNDIIHDDFIPMHSIIIKPNIYNDHDLRMFEKCFYVDIQYVCYALPYIDTIKIIGLDFYQYRLNRDGQSVSTAGFLKHAQDHERVIMSIFDLVKNFDAHDSKIMDYYIFIISALLEFDLSLYLKESLKDKKRKGEVELFVKTIKEQYKEILPRIKLSRLVKLAMKTNMKSAKILVAVRKMKRAIIN